MPAPIGESCMFYDRHLSHIFSQNEATTGVFYANLHVKQHDKMGDLPTSSGLYDVSIPPL